MLIIDIPIMISISLINTLLSRPPIISVIGSLATIMYAKQKFNIYFFNYRITNDAIFLIQKGGVANGGINFITELPQVIFLSFYFIYLGIQLSIINKLAYICILSGQFTQVLFIAQILFYMLINFINIQTNNYLLYIIDKRDNSKYIILFYIGFLYYNDQNEYCVFHKFVYFIFN